MYSHTPSRFDSTTSQLRLCGGERRCEPGGASLPGLTSRGRKGRMSVRRTLYKRDKSVRVFNSIDMVDVGDEDIGAVVAVDVWLIESILPTSIQVAIRQGIE